MAFWRNYSPRALVADAAAGVTVSLLALPLALGFAIASGATPRAGLACAIVGGLAVALFGGARLQIAGPTGAFVLLSASILTRYGFDGLIVAALMTGAMLIVLGATGMGLAVKYLPRPIIVGFMNGISVILAITQIKECLGPVTGAGTWAQPWLPHWPSALLAAACVALMVICARRETRMPGGIVAAGAGTLLAMMFNIPVETIAMRFADTPGAWLDSRHLALFAWHLPPPRWDLAWTLLPASFAMTVLIAIESLMSAVEADRLTGERHDENRELIAQGLANIASPLLGGLPVSGSALRTETNIRAGARTRVAAVVHALAIVAMAFLIAPLAGAIPLPLLGALLLGVAWTMGGWAELPSVVRTSVPDAMAWLATFLLVLFADLTQAVPAAMALAALLFIRTVAAGTTGARVSEDVADADAQTAQAARDGDRDGGGGGDADSEGGAALPAPAPAPAAAAAPAPAYMAVFRITGPFLFAGTDTLSTIVDRLDSLPPIVLLRLREMTSADATSLRAIVALADRIRASGRMLLVSGAQPQPADVMRRMRFHDQLGADNVCESDDEALARARQLYQECFQPGFPFGTLAGGPLAAQASLASRHS